MCLGLKIKHDCCLGRLCCVLLMAMLAGILSGLKIGANFMLRTLHELAFIGKQTNLLFIVGTNAFILYFFSKKFNFGAFFKLFTLGLYIVFGGYYKTEYFLPQILNSKLLLDGL